MDTITSLVIKYLPASVLPYLKGVVAALGSAISVVLAVYPGVSDLKWYTLASAAVTALATYLVPNIGVTAGVPSDGPAAKPVDDGLPTVTESDSTEPAAPVVSPPAA